MISFAEILSRARSTTFKAFVVLRGTAIYSQFLQLKSFFVPGEGGGYRALFGTVQMAANAASAVPREILANTTAPSPSGIDSFPEPTQAACVLGIYALLGMGTALFTGPGFVALQKLLPIGWFDALVRSFWLVGPFFVTTGILHFAFMRNFSSVFPPRGTWGIWYLPGNPKFHVGWTGLAEIVGGLGIIIGAWTGRSGLLRSSSACLVALILAVTPADIYMFTHGAEPIPGLDLPIWGNDLFAVKYSTSFDESECGDILNSSFVVRLVMQILLLSMCVTMAGFSSEGHLKTA